MSVRNALSYRQIWQGSDGVPQLERDRPPCPFNVFGMHKFAGPHPTISSCSQIRVIGVRDRTVS
jgi:hypothetical protein